MTLILAIESKEGLVLAGDSQGTAGLMISPIQKIFTCGQSLAWGFAGNVGMAQQVTHKLGQGLGKMSRLDQGTPPAVRDKIMEKFREALKELVSTNQLNADGTVPNTTPPELAFGFLFVAYCGGQPLILTSMSSKANVEHTPAGFHALGSGDIYPLYAMAAMKHFGLKSRSLFEAKLMAYRILEDAISFSNTAIGHPIRMIEIHAPPTATDKPRAIELSNTDLLVLRDQALMWRLAEAEALTEFVGAQLQGTNIPLSPPGP